MLRIAICDDEKIYTDSIQICVHKFLTGKSVEARIFKYTSAKKLIEDHQACPFDILFLDIDMPVVTGFDISKEVRDTNDPVYIVYISAKHELVYNSFEFNPFYFICKTEHEILNREISHVMSKLLLHYQQHRKITINDPSNGPSIVTVKDIMYIKSDKHYISYYPVKRIDPYTERGTINDKESELSSPDFVRTHQRYLVNMNHIARFDGLINTITLCNNEQLPLSKSLKKSALETYLTFKRR